MINRILFVLWTATYFASLSSSQALERFWDGVRRCRPGPYGFLVGLGGWLGLSGFVAALGVPGVAMGMLEGCFRGQRQIAEGGGILFYVDARLCI